MTLSYQVDNYTIIDIVVVVAILVFTYYLRRIINHLKKYKSGVNQIPDKLIIK